MQSDNWIIESFEDAITFQMPKALRRLFATILVYCQPKNVRVLWNMFYENISEDLGRSPMVTANTRLRKTIDDIGFYLDSMGKNISKYDLPRPFQERNNSGFRKEYKQVRLTLAAYTLDVDKQAVKYLNT